ncbi:hypothetical protein ACIRBY_23560 [Streptomyces sp. NPDC096136]|uniref:hypothetical protein n=1 Tax=Streptomyces sp. NPDC096136 TaxID=3366076 RepID=UPI0037FC3300
MNRTRRLAALTLLAAPALALGPAVAAHALPSAGTCKVEADSAGKYHLWGVGFPSGTVTYTGSVSGTVPTNAGRFDVGGLTGSKYVVKAADGTTVTCTVVRH